VVFLVAGVIMGPVTVASASSVTLLFSSSDYAELKFIGTGNFFSFDKNTAANDFSINNEIPVGPSIGLKGDIDGTFVIGDITTFGVIQSAPVSSPGLTTLSIKDGSGLIFKANIDLTDITTFGTAGGLNIDGLVNLANRTYTGDNVDLRSLRDNGGSAIVSFSFNPKHTLFDLTEDGKTHVTSYSGSLTFDLVPLPSTVLLLGSGLVGLGLLRFRRRQPKS
jgi:hypothetical protein